MRIGELPQIQRWGRAIRVALEYVRLSALGAVCGELIWITLYLAAAAWAG